LSIIDDKNLDFLLYDVFEVEKLCAFPFYVDHNRESFDLFLKNVRRFAREKLFPLYPQMDQDAPEFVDGQLQTHPVMKTLYSEIADLGTIGATRDYDAGGSQLPFTVYASALLYMKGANLHASGFAGLTAGAANLIRTYGSDVLKTVYLEPMMGGRWTGTMALTEPQAGSSLADLTSSASPTSQGHHLIKGAKIFISGGDNSFSENIVHLALARIEGAPLGTSGISLFVVPKKRPTPSGLVDNDVATTGIVHKLGWRGLPSVMLGFGERGDCHGYLVGEPHKGLRYMFQMMNEARLGVGVSGAATASAAYIASLQYARDRPQGRPLGTPASEPMVPIVQHADVRRMLLKQKAIVEGSLALSLQTSVYADVSEHAPDEESRAQAGALLDLLTPMTKTFPAEFGFVSNTLAVQILGGYGYTSEYLPESWLRDQKLNSLHEGTTGIQGMDLLGRKVMRDGGRSLGTLRELIEEEIARAELAPLPAAWTAHLRLALDEVTRVVTTLAERASDSPTRMMAHSSDFMEMLSVVVVAWQWLRMARIAESRRTSLGNDFVEGKKRAAGYWFVHELSKTAALAQLIVDDDDTFFGMEDASF